MKKQLSILILILFAASFAGAQNTTESLLQIHDRYWMQPDIVYSTANNTPLKLDVWYPRDNPNPTPTLVYIHGGGWIFGSKEGAILQTLPYMEKGWRVVNVEYRMAGNSLAPAAVEDARCALRWVFRNAKLYNFDTSKIVVTGHSAGGHLALMMGMLSDGNPLDNQCYADEKYGDVKMKVAAIVNWYGPTDIYDLFQGENLRNYGKMWIGSQSNPKEIADKVSPLTYVRAGLPPTISIHGDKDDVVPYSHATRLHAELDKVKVPNKLVTIKNGGHGQFQLDGYKTAFDEIWKFLRAAKVAE